MWIHQTADSETGALEEGRSELKTRSVKLAVLQITQRSRRERGVKAMCPCVNATVRWGRECSSTAASGTLTLVRISSYITPSPPKHTLSSSAIC